MLPLPAGEGWGGGPKVQIVTVGSIYPQLDFLSVVLSYANIEINGKCASGLSLILARISEELQAAIKEVPDADT